MNVQQADKAAKNGDKPASVIKKEVKAGVTYNV